MRIKINFESSVVIEGDTLEDIRSKWLDLYLFSNDADDNDAEYEQLISARELDEDDDIIKDVTKEILQWDNTNQRTD